MPVSASNGASAAWKSCCSCAVHSAHNVTEPPIFALDELEFEDDAAGDAQPHAVAIPRIPAVTTASLPSVPTWVIKVLLTGACGPQWPNLFEVRCTPHVLETQLPQIRSHTN